MKPDIFQVVRSAVIAFNAKLSEARRPVQHPKLKSSMKNLAKKSPSRR